MDISSEPQRIILSLLMSFRWLKLTIGISKKKINSPFRDNKRPLWNSVRPNFSLWYKGKVVKSWKNSIAVIKLTKRKIQNILSLKTEAGISVSLFAMSKSAGFLRSFTNKVKIKIDKILILQHLLIMMQNILEKKFRLTTKIYIFYIFI